MSMFWSERGTTVTCEKGGEVFAHLLRGASIAALAWSCISPATGDELPPSVLVISPSAQDLKYRSNQTEVAPSMLEATSTSTEDTPTQVENDLVQFLLDQGEQYKDPDLQDADKILIMSIAFKTKAGEEKLVAFKFDGSPVSPADETPLKDEPVIPEVDLKKPFKAIIIYTASPADGQGCGNSGGTAYCKKL
jgi:hypothetical protein